MYSRSTIIPPVSGRFPFLLSAVAFPGLHFSAFFLLPYSKLLVIPNFLPFSGDFVCFSQDSFKQW